MAVQTWRWVDDTTAEFTLKQGMRFHNKPPVNGREVVAQDFESAFRRYQQNFVRLAGMSATVQSITTTGKYTFQMRLKSPWGGLVTELLGHYWGPWLEAAEVGGPDGKLWEQPDKSYIGSGAFMFDSWEPGVKWRLVRNPDYWVKGRPYLEGVEYVVIPEASTRMAVLRSGQINLILEFSEELLGEAQGSIPGLQVTRCPGSDMTGAGIVWMNNSGPPFSDVRVRRAVAMAIDRETIAKSLYKGNATVVPVLPSITQYALAIKDFPEEVRPFLGYHPERPKQLLTEAGYPQGFSTTINFTPAYPPPSVMVSEAVAEMLGRVGIRARLLLLEKGRYNATVLDPNYPVGELAISSRIASTPEDGSAFTTFWSKAGSPNRSVVRDPEYDKLFEEFRRSTDERKRTDLARQLQVMIASRAYAAFLAFPDSTLTVLPGIHYIWVGNTRDYSMLLETMWIE